MKSLPAIIRSLQTSRYLEAQLGKNGEIIDSELLSNGKRYCEQLLKQWRLSRSDDMPTHFVDNVIDEPFITTSRLAFIHSQSFRSNMRLLSVDSTQATQWPALIKSKYNKAPYADTQSKYLPSTTSGADRGTFLVSDFFHHSGSGLEMFYNIQRESKIWWMRFSSNPSRYFVEPFDLQAAEKTASANCQSITIKSRLQSTVPPLAVEHLTLVPLENIDNFQLYDEHTAKGSLPAVIRSVIDLKAATCAMLFDGSYHNRNDTLLLNRKLAPYQCTLGCLYKENSLVDLRDLCAHLSFVMQRAGLRLFDDGRTFTNCPNLLNRELHAADSMGIPYAILIEEETLNTGLLKLRNRDTTLEETIHISDIPAYLLNIFTH